MRLQKACFYLFCLLVFITACKKPDDAPCPPPHGIYYIDSMMYPYMFAQGSQWVYQNEGDSSMDTMTQTMESLYINRETFSGGTANMTGGCSTTYEHEDFSAVYAHSAYGIDDHGDITFSTTISRGGRSGGYLLLADLQPGEELGKSRVEAIHGSLTIGNHTFQHVTQMYAGAETIYQWSMRLYFAPDVGVVRQEYLRADTVFNAFNLVDWNVTPFH